MSKLTNTEIEALWHKHEGEAQDSKRTISEDGFQKFLAEVMALTDRRWNWDLVADEMGSDYAKKHRGPRP